MNDFVNDCFHLSGSQGMSDLRARRGNYKTLSILIGNAPSSRKLNNSDIPGYCTLL